MGMKPQALLASILLFAGCFGAPPQHDLSPGAYIFIMDATDIPDEETEHSESKCTVSRDETNLTVACSTPSGGANLVGSLQGNHILLTVHHEKPDPMIKAMQLRMILEGQADAKDHARGILKGYAGTNMYIKGTWELRKIHESPASNKAIDDD